MPYSADENRSLVRDFVVSNGIKTVIDIGPGAGRYADVLSDLSIDYIDAVEVWEPYVSEFSLNDKYRHVHILDIREFETENSYDLVIFGDILEHMSEEEAKDVWSRARNYAKWGLISVPIVHYPQGPEFGNPYEVHVQDHLTPEQIREVYGPFETEGIYDVTGTFIRRLEN